MRLTASLVRDGRGVPLHCIAQIGDITGSKRLEHMLGSARDEAVAASRLKSEFLAMVIQEFQSPIDAIVVASRLLRKMPRTPLQAEHIRTIDVAGESLLSVSSEISHYSKIEAGEITLEAVPFDLRHCVNAAVALFAECNAST